MNETDKLTVLLDDPSVRAMIFALEHSGPDAGASRLRDIAANTLAFASDVQRLSWLEPSIEKVPMSVEEVHAVLTDDVVQRVATYLMTDLSDVVIQLAELLPDLVDALTPAGDLLAVDVLAEMLRTIVIFDDRSAGAFGL